MRIVIEKRVEMADQGTSERRVELEFDGNEHAGALALDSLHIVKHLIAALDGRPESPNQ
jgi:hypothetical protein